jgi:hypothetical protein
MTVFLELCSKHCRMHINRDPAFKSPIFWDITPCSPVKVNRSLSGTRRLHLQSSSTLCLFHAGLLLGLLFNAEDGGDMFLRNIGWLSTNYNGIISQKTELFTIITLGTTNPTKITPVSSLFGYGLYLGWPADRVTGSCGNENSWLAGWRQVRHASYTTRVCRQQALS